MGAGKSAVGRRLARRLGWDLFDSDRQVEAMTGRTVPEIWRADGEAAFRLLERQVLADALASTTPKVVAAAGGVVLDEENRRLLRQHRPVVWLRAPIETLIVRVRKGEGRPLLDDDPAAAMRRLDACGARCTPRWPTSSSTSTTTTPPTRHRAGRARARPVGA